MLAWPEALLFGSHKATVPLQFYIQLGFLLIATSLSLLGVIALASSTGYSWSARQPPGLTGIFISPRKILEIRLMCRASRQIIA
jgi:hypothetical protein